MDANQKNEISWYRRQRRKFKKPIKSRGAPPAVMVFRGFDVEIFFRENFTKRKYENFLKRAEQSMNEFLENFNAETREFYEKNRLNFAAENDIV
jgi:hypothetical protein